MDNLFYTLPFAPADILLPQNCDLSLWSVVACDQYTSQPEYWQRVEQRVGKAPSTLRLILPESRLNNPDVEMEINGLITYDRKVIKLDESKLREIHEKVRKHADAKE